MKLNQELEKHKFNFLLLFEHLHYESKSSWCISLGVHTSKQPLDQEVKSIQE